MILSDQEITLLSALSPEVVTKFLEARGWEREENLYSTYVIWRKKSCRGCRVVVPIHRDFRDYVERMAEVVLELIRVKEIPAIEIMLNEINKTVNNIDKGEDQCDHR